MMDRKHTDQLGSSATVSGTEGVDSRAGKPKEIDGGCIPYIYIYIHTPAGTPSCGHGRVLFPMLAAFSSVTPDPCWGRNDDPLVPSVRRETPSPLPSPGRLQCALRPETPASRPPPDGLLAGERALGPRPILGSSSPALASSQPGPGAVLSTRRAGQSACHVHVGYRGSHGVLRRCLPATPVKTGEMAGSLPARYNVVMGAGLDAVEEPGGGMR